MLHDMNSRHGRSLLNFTPNADTVSAGVLRGSVRFKGGTVEYLIKTKDKTNSNALLRISFGSICPREGVALLSCNPALCRMATVSAPTFFVEKQTQAVEILVRTFDDFDPMKLDWLIELSI